jgi:ABC-type sulfate transport system substrate-binding protein
MEYVRIAEYSIQNGTFQEIAEKAKMGMLPKFQEQTGFVRYGLADVDGGNALSISIWNTREDAVAAEAVAATWIRENLGDKITLKSSHVGTLAFLEGVPATV